VFLFHFLYSPLIGAEQRAKGKRNLFSTVSCFRVYEPTPPLIPNQGEPLAKLLKARGSRHSGQAERDPESSIFERFWIPAFAGMTE
jgi:hypothetical protein